MTFELGVNYWPRRSAMYMWRKFDIDEVRDEMSQIASMGFDVVRVFALTQDFLPRPKRNSAVTLFVQIRHEFAQLSPG